MYWQHVPSWHGQELKVPLNPELQYIHLISKHYGNLKMRMRGHTACIKQLATSPWLSFNLPWICRNPNSEHTGCRSGFHDAGDFLFRAGDEMKDMDGFASIRDIPGFIARCCFFFAHLKDIILLAGNTVLYRTSGVNFCLTAELYQLFTSARNDVDADDPEEIFDQDWIFRNLKYQQLPRFCIIHIIPLIFMRYIYSFIYLFIECSSFFLAFTHHLSILILAGSISPILGRTGRSGNKEADFVEGNDEYGGPKHESKAWLWWRSWEKKDSCWL